LQSELLPPTVYAAVTCVRSRRPSVLPLKTELRCFRINSQPVVQMVMMTAVVMIMLPSSLQHSTFCLFHPPMNILREDFGSQRLLVAGKVHTCGCLMTMVMMTYDTNAPLPVFEEGMFICAEVSQVFNPNYFLSKLRSWLECNVCFLLTLLPRLPLPHMGPDLTAPNKLYCSSKGS
jgi:hypothetical protein